MLKKYNAFVRGTNKVCGFLLGIVMLALFVVLMLQITSRFVMFMQLPWSQDMITFLLVCSAFLGVGSATGNGKQIRLEFFVDIFPKKTKAILTIIAELISIVFVCVVTVQAIELARDNMSVHMGTSLVSVGAYYAVVAFGCFTMALNFVSLILKETDILTGKEEAEA